MIQPKDFYTYGTDTQIQRIKRHDRTIGLLRARGCRHAGRELFQCLPFNPVQQTQSVPGNEAQLLIPRSELLKLLKMD
jgi:hypothetical protein